MSPASPVSPVSPVSSVSLAHLWVDFRVILERLDLLLLDFPLFSLFSLLARHHKLLLQPVFDHASLGWKEPGELFYSSTQVMFAHLNQSENDPIKVWLQRGARLEGPGQVGWCVEVPFGLE